MKLLPAEYVIHKLGGVRPAARELGYSPSAISNWRKSGEVPTKARSIILAYCKVKNMNITADHLQYGGTIRRLTDMK